VVTTQETPFEIGKAYTFYESELVSNAKVGIIACGQMVYHSIIAAKKLESLGYQVGVLNMASIKPMDIDAVVAFAHKYGRIVTAEEHQIAGGMGSAVAEILAVQRPTPIEFVGIKDVFGESGAPEELMIHFGLTAEGIVEAVQRLEHR
jgi:transketolase